MNNTKTTNITVSLEEDTLATFKEAFLQPTPALCAPRPLTRR